MKKFDLERALAGEPVITRKGKKVTELHLFKGGKLIQPLFGTIEGEEGYFCFEKDGMYNYSSTETSFDLFMAPEKKSIWVNLYEYDNGQLWVGCYYNSLEEASKPGTHMGRYIKTIEITNEV
jgi:hypothetical protein